MFIKKFSHLHKARKHRSGDCFAVLGYPRSGTTMMSEVIGMVTDFYFDRDNIYPSSSKVVLHTHWNPNRFRPDLSVYILRDPMDVSLSVIDYANVRGWNIDPAEALKSRKICKIPWLEHVQEAQSGGHHIVNYDSFTRRDPEEIERLAKHLSVDANWVEVAMRLLAEKHAGQPHQSDLKFQAQKATRTTDRLAKLQEHLEPAIVEERKLFDSLTAVG